MKSTHRFLASALVALALVCFSFPAFAATELGASFSDCVACDNGTVELIMDGGSAIVRGLQEDADNPGHWSGVGSVVYSAQGVSINDVGAHFEVVIESRPVICDPRATAMAVSIRVIGSAVGYVLSSSNFRYDTEPVTCWSRGLVDVVIDDHPKSVGKLKKLYRADSGTYISPSGRTYKV